jgi:hypothetical protein
MSASIWAPGTAVTASGSIAKQAFEATASQTLFNLTEFTYDIGTGSLAVFVSGLKQRPGVDFVETSASSFTLDTPVAEGTVVFAEAFTELTSEIPVIDSTPATIGASKYVVTNAGATAFEGKSAAQVAADLGALVTADIGVTVQGYDADTPTTAASQVEMEAGTEAAIRSMSPLRVAQAIAALAGVTLTRTTFTASGNLTFPAGVTQAWVTGQGCGGGGGGTTAGGNGGTTTFGPNGGAVVLTLGGGTGGSAASGTTGGAGGAGGGSGITKGRSGRAGQYKATIGGGVNPAAYCVAVGGPGGAGECGELGSGGNGGDGGAGGGGVSSAAAGGGGGAGEQCFSFPVTVTAAQWDVIIGSAGTAGTADGGTAPQAGQTGFLIVEYLS